MLQNDFVSVTIVTYNSGRFIKRCLESVLAQKYPQKEIIVVDNASTDGTTDIFELFEDVGGSVGRGVIDDDDFFLRILLREDRLEAAFDKTAAVVSHNRNGYEVVLQHELEPEDPTANMN